MQVLLSIQILYKKTFFKQEGKQNKWCIWICWSMFSLTRINFDIVLNIINILNLYVSPKLPNSKKRYLFIKNKTILCRNIYILYDL